MSFLIEGDELPEKYDKICDKFSNGIKNKFESKLVWKNEKYLENKNKVS